MAQLLEECASCQIQLVKNDAEKEVVKENLDESLCGDPLMYATFVAPVHQYSTETEPSRQASFNYPSRQPSFKQNSSEGADSQPDLLTSSADGHLGLPSRHPLRTSLTPPEPEAVWKMQKDQDLEISQEELERQVQMERLSFISGSSANEEDDLEEDEDEEEDPMAVLLPPPPPLPPKPPVLLNQQPRLLGLYRDPYDASDNFVETMPAPGGIGTVRRKAQKRERNRTLNANNASVASVASVAVIGKENVVQSNDIKSALRSSSASKSR